MGFIAEGGITKGGDTPPLREAGMPVGRVAADAPAAFMCARRASISVTVKVAQFALFAWIGFPSFAAPALMSGAAAGISKGLTRAARA